MNDILHEFGDCSSLKVSASKSKDLCSKGVSASNKCLLANMCLIAFVRDLGKYLGSPFKGGRASPYINLIIPLTK